MDHILQGIPGTLCYLDDILVTSTDKAQHLERLRAVFEQLKQHGLTLKKEKCKFMTDSVTYLGHVIDEKGVHPTQDKVEAIINAAPPSNVTQLRSFLGLVQYYAKFLPNLASIMEPLYQLLRKEVGWEWNSQCQKAFDTVKVMLASPPVLAHYDVTLPIKTASNASAYGLGAVLSHVTEEGERPVGFISRSLTPSEKNYSQIEKEAYQ